MGSRRRRAGGGRPQGATYCKYVADFDAEARVRRLVMVGAATPASRRPRPSPYGLDEVTAAATLEGIRRGFPEAMAAFKGANFHRSDLAATQEWFLSSWLQLPAYAAYRYFKTLLTEDLREQVGRVRVPTALFHGRHDLVCHPGWAQWMAARIPGARFVWFEESGHALMVEEPDRFSGELAAFIG